MSGTFGLWSPGELRPSRRSFLRIGAAGLAGLTLGEALRAEDKPATASPPARNVIMLFLTGGPATIDMWDMKPEAPASIRGEFRPIDTSVSGLQICEHMPQLAKAMHLATLVRSVTHTIAEHTQGQRYLMTGNAPSPAVESASLGSLASHLIRDRKGIPPYATLGDVPAANSGDLGAAFNPFAIPSLERIIRGKDKEDEAGGAEKGGSDRIGLPEGVTREDFFRRLKIRDRLDQRMAGGAAADLAGQLDRFHAEAVEILRSDAINGALQIGQEGAAVRERYGESDLGRRMLAARRLVEAGARFVTIGFGDWDTHLNNFSRMQQSLLPQLDRALASLLTDLEERGLLKETVVYCTGEFGRTPAVNGNAGRDHWARTMTALVAGGGFRRGIAYGATDREGVEPTSGPCSPDDLSATIFRQLSFGPAHLATTRTGRPIRIFPAGTPVEGLIEAGV